MLLKTKVHAEIMVNYLLICLFHSWYDGFSTFYVGGDGLVQKHVVDKVLNKFLLINSYTLNNSVKEKLFICPIYDSR